MPASRGALAFDGGQDPLFLLPLGLYGAPLPRAKSLVGAPMAVYRGALRAAGREIPIDGWVGSQNHNWGTRHTDRYAWGQVAGFDNAPDSFLEVATGQLKAGRLWTPRMTLLVLRHEGEEYALRSLWRAMAIARGRFGPGENTFHWDFASRGRGIEPSHAVFSSGRAIMITLETTARALEALLPAGVRVIGRKEPSLRDAIEVLGELGCTTISILPSGL